MKNYPHPLSQKNVVFKMPYNAETAREFTGDPQLTTEAMMQIHRREDFQMHGFCESVQIIEGDFMAEITFYSPRMGRIQTWREVSKVRSI